MEEQNPLLKFDALPAFSKVSAQKQNKSGGKKVVTSSYCHNA